MMTLPTDDGFHLGRVYSLRYGKTTELIPRSAISYVSAKYESRPALLALAAAALLFGGYMGMSGSRDPLSVFGPVILGAILVVAFFTSRRMGIVIASSGGRLFIETRGRNRLSIIDAIHADLMRDRGHTAEADRIPPIDADAWR